MAACDGPGPTQSVDALRATLAGYPPDRAR